MAISRTKYNATNDEIAQLFEANGIGKMLRNEPLGDGEFNAAFKVTCENGKDYVLKIAPPEEALVLTYEKNMMDSEVYWYRQMKENTDILCPDIYAVDLSYNIIKSRCFIINMVRRGMTDSNYGPTLEDFTHQLDIPMAGIIPYDENIEIGNNVGRSVFFEEASYIARNIDDIITRMLG